MQYEIIRCYLLCAHNTQKIGQLEDRIQVKVTERTNVPVFFSKTSGNPMNKFHLS